MGENDWDWTQFELDVEGAYLDDEGYYRCEECNEILESTGEIDRSGDVPLVTFACPDCGEGYPIPASGPTPKSTWIEFE